MPNGRPAPRLKLLLCGRVSVLVAACLRCHVLIVVVLLAGVLPAGAGELGLLWKIEPPQGRASYIFGTMHVDDARATDFSPKLRAALAESDGFMLEVLPPRDSGLLFMPQGSLRDLLTAAEIDALLRLADTHAMERETVLRMKPWLPALLFARPRPAGPYTQDMQLLALAAEQGKAILALETTQEHFAALDALSQAEQLALLHTVLAQSQEEKEQDYQTLLAAYLSRDAERIAAMDEAISGRGLPPGLWEKMRVLLIDRRNAAMAERIVRHTAERSEFIAVGAAHLQGKGGLLSRLRAAGYKLSVVE